MRKEYDFSAASKNPYAAQLKKQITIRLDEESVNYFKNSSEEVGRISCWDESTRATECNPSCPTSPRQSPAIPC
jgi:hypothetical protein